jgi:hypothetical protein
MTRARDLADSADKDIAGTLTLDAVNASGVITGLTVEATGDTAAGDNAAMGYTAAEGLILTGQGSSGDITIKNDADAVVLQVPTGTTNVNVIGSLDVATNAVIDGTALVTGVLTTTAATVFNGGFASNNVSTIIAADGAGNNAYALQIKNQESTDDRSYGVLIQAGSTGTDAPLNITTHDGGTALFTMVGSGQAQFVDGTASLPAISNLADLNTGIFFPAADEIGFTDGGVEAARFSAAGQLLIKHTTSVATAGHHAALQLTGAGAGDYSDATLSTIGNSANSNGSYLHFGKSRSNSAGGVTVVADDDTVGQFNFCAADGTDLNSRAASITVQMDGTPGANDVPGRIQFATTTDGASSPTNRMTITSGGNVGIGTGVPTTNYARGLHIATTGTGANLKLTDTSTGAGADDGFELISTGGHAYVWQRENSNLVFGTNDTERMRLSAAGELFIGKLGEVSTQDGFQFKQTGECIIGRGSNDTIFVFQDTNTSGNTVGSISMTSNATAYNTSSDYRLKENVDYNWDATTRLKQLKPARFNFISDNTNTLVDGFLAHEAQAVVPQAVFGTKDAVQVWKNGDNLPDGVSVGDNKLDDDGNTSPQYQAIDHSKLVPLLVKTIQELEARITALEA